MNATVLKKIPVGQRFDFLTDVAAAVIQHGAVTCGGTLRCLNEYLLERPLPQVELEGIVGAAQKLHLTKISAT